MLRIPGSFSKTKQTRSPMYMIEGRMGYRGSEFVKDAQKLYSEVKTKYPNLKRPTTIKSAVELASKLSRKVYTKETGSNWMLIH